MRVAVADEAEARDGAAAIDVGREPHLADAALHLVGGGAVVLGQRRKLAAKLDDVAVAILPIVEQLEIGEDFLKAPDRHGLGNCVHPLNMATTTSRFKRKLGRANWEGKGRNLPNCA